MIVVLHLAIKLGALRYMRSASVLPVSDGRGATFRSFRAPFLPDPRLVAFEDTGAEICPAEMTLFPSSEDESRDAVSPGAECRGRARGGEPISGGGFSGIRPSALPPRRLPPEVAAFTDATVLPLRRSRFGERLGEFFGDVELFSDAGPEPLTNFAPVLEPSGKSAGGAGFAPEDSAPVFRARVGLPSG